MHIKLSVLIVVVLALGACATVTPEVRPELVEKFRHDTMPSEMETHVYVVRGSAFQGGAVGIDLGVNDELVASLSNATHALVKLVSGPNNVYLSQYGQTFFHKTVDDRPGEIVYFYHDYQAGSFEEVRPALGQSLIMQTKRSTSSASRDKAKYYANVLMNPSAMGIKLIKSDSEKEGLMPDSESAILTISRQNVLYKEFELTIWKNYDIAAILSGESLAQIRLTPGDHTLYTYMNGFSPLKIEVEAGKEYFVALDIDKVDGTIGTPWKYVANWKAFDANNYSSFYGTHLQGLKYAMIDTELVKSKSVAYRINQATEYFKKHMNTNKLKSDSSEDLRNAVLVSAKMGKI